MGRVIDCVWRKIAPKQEQCEMEPKRLQRDVTHREKMIGKEQGRLQNTISKFGKLHDRKNKALIGVQNTNARNLLLRDQRDANLLTERRPRRDETPEAYSVPTRRATAIWTKRRTRRSHLHAKSTGAMMGAKAARGKSARAGAGAGG
jgi:hypothetical protein